MYMLHIKKTAPVSEYIYKKLYVSEYIYKGTVSEPLYICYIKEIVPV